MDNAINRNEFNEKDSNDDDDDDCVVIEEINVKTPKRFKTATISQAKDDNSDNEIEDGIIGMKVRSPINNRLNKVACESSHPDPNPTPKASDGS